MWELRRVFYNSTDNGTTWNQYNTGMPAYAAVDELVLQTGTNTLFAFTHGRSVWMNNTPLPVELENFTGRCVNNAVQLTWNTATETNNYGFQIERASSLGGTSPHQGWDNIGFVSGSGSSTQPHQYNYIDKNVSNQSYAYRVKQMDFDGQFHYSPVINVDASSVVTSFSLNQNYLNPFNPSTKISYSIPVNNQKVVLKVYDAAGREVAALVNKVEQSGNYEVQFNGSNLASGVYFYRLTAGNFTSTKKMLLIK